MLRFHPCVVHRPPRFEFLLMAFLWMMPKVVRWICPCCLWSGSPVPKFIEAFERLAALVTKAGIEGKPITIHAPLVHLSKAQTIREGLRLGLDYGLTHTCYDPLPGPSGEIALACGRCDACLLRLAGFRDAGETDPVPYDTSHSETRP